MTIPAVILCTDVPPEPLRVGGLPLIVRHIKELYKLGIREIYLYGLETIPPEFSPYGLPEAVRLQPLSGTLDSLPRHLCTSLASSNDLILVRGDCLIDPRLFAELLTRPMPLWLQTTPVDAKVLPAAARLSSKLLDTWADEGLAPWQSNSPSLTIASLNPYSPSHRGPVPFYVEDVQTPAEAAAATRILIRSAQKRALDFPALLLHPHFENRLVYWLCSTRITPNQITVFTTVLGALVAILFLNGWLRSGILLGYLVAILDGVDGKLARTKLQTSRFGEFEHVFDFFVEHSWYLTITMFLAASTGSRLLWWIGGGLMVCDVLDNILYYLGQVFLGKQLDELGRFDRGFRLIGGRRNIYAWMFFVGFYSGFPVQSLIAAAIWAAVTMGVHGIRLAYHVMRHKRRRLRASDSR